LITIKDKSGKTKYVWTDESSEPIEISDEKVKDEKPTNQKRKEQPTK